VAVKPPFAAGPQHDSSMVVGRDYRIYRLDRVRHVVEVEFVTAACDRDAIAAARAMPNSARREVWLGERLVATIDIESTGEPSAAFWL